MKIVNDQRHDGVDYYVRGTRPTRLDAYLTLVGARVDTYTGQTNGSSYVYRCVPLAEVRAHLPGFVAAHPRMAAWAAKKFGAEFCG
jgi:glutathione S-transferase